jgi:PAS domain S-box-containing protein
MTSGQGVHAAVVDAVGPDREQGQALYAEQLRLLYANLPVGLAGTVASAFVLAFVQWDVIAHAVVTAWLGCLLLVSAARYALMRAYESARIPFGQERRWDVLVSAGAGLSGLVWGSAGIFLFPFDINHQVFVIFALAGMTAGAVVSFSALMHVALIFLIPTLTPLTVRLFMGGGTVHAAMGFMASLFTLLMLVAAWRMYAGTRDSLLLRFENSDLVTYLEGEKEAIEKLNTELKSEIRQRARIEEGLRQSEARIRAVVDNVLDGIITINELGILASVNPATERIFDYRSDELVGQHFKVLMPEAEREEYDDYIKRHLGERMIGFGLEIGGQRKDGSVFPMELGISEMRHDEGRLFIGIVRDITERKKVERLKSQFISVVSHELRTPLTSVLGSLGLLREGIAGELSERGKSLLSIAHNNIDRLVRLIGDILEVEDIQSGKMRLDKRAIDLAALVHNTVATNRSYAAERAVDLHLDVCVSSLPVHADYARVVQALNHLLSNAIKFSPPNSVVDVALTRCDRGVRVSVADQGPGIPGDFQPRLFQIFAKADEDDARRGGAGLGLSIAKAIVEKHGGVIGFEAGRDRGARFYFELPEWQDECVINAR